MAYGLDLRLFVENGPAARSAAYSAIVRGPSSRRIVAGLRRQRLLPANDQPAANVGDVGDVGDGYPIAL